MRASFENTYHDSTNSGAVRSARLWIRCRSASWWGLRADSPSTSRIFTWFYADFFSGWGYLSAPELSPKYLSK